MSYHQAINYGMHWFQKYSQVVNCLSQQPFAICLQDHYVDDVGDVVFYKQDTNYSSLTWAYLSALAKKLNWGGRRAADDRQTTGSRHDDPTPATHGRGPRGRRQVFIRWEWSGEWLVRVCRHRGNYALCMSALQVPCVQQVPWSRRQVSHPLVLAWASSGSVVG